MNPNLQETPPSQNTPPNQASNSNHNQPANQHNKNIDHNTNPEQLNEKTFSSDTGQDESRLVSILKFFVSWIVVPLVIVFLFQALVFQAFYVSGQSMEPTFQDGDYLVISKIGVSSKKFRTVFNKKAKLNYKRGDVLIFNPPISVKTYYIKRLIGLPGERVVIKDGKITIYNKENPAGFTLNEPYDKTAITTGDLDITVDADKLFVLGDNREPNGSFDSRAWGQLPQNMVNGRVVIRLLPLHRFLLVPRPTYALLEYPFYNLAKLLL